MFQFFLSPRVSEIYIQKSNADTVECLSNVKRQENERPIKREAIKVKSNTAPVKKLPVETPKFEDEKGSKIIKITKQAMTGTKPVKQVIPTEKNVEIGKQEELNHNQKEKVQEEGQFQLNQLMQHVLEEELQDVMIQIWKTLPDLASSDVERLVTERLRDGASDDLKKIIGLNVTKRLLNMSNPLFVKIKFSGRPENGLLTKFLHTYNIVSFKRINQESNTFAAKFNTISDFDNICSAKDIRCGSAQIKVTPCYKFTKCPENLNTIYVNTTQYEFNIDNENFVNIDNDNKLNNCIENIKVKEIPNKLEILVKTKQEEKETPVTKTQIKLKAQQNKKPVKNKTKSLENKCKMKDIEYDNDMYEEINEMDPEFNEEMDDDEILALISGGVVVDQCNGSDQE